MPHALTVPPARVLVTLAAALLLAGCAPTPPCEPTPVPSPTGTFVPTTPPTATPSPAPSTPPAPPPPAPGEVAGALRPLPLPTDCTVRADGPVAVSAVANAKPGDRVCVTGADGKSVGKLAIKTSGTEAKPIAILGDGKVIASKLDIRADWIYVSGLNIIEPQAPGISVTGNHVVVIDSTVDKPSGGDGDVARFWGSFLKFTHNTFSRTNNKNGHADCFQNFSTSPSYPETHDVEISWNRCEEIANIAVISEGPHSSFGDGSKRGNTYKLWIHHNYFQAKSAQAIWLDDVQDVRVLDNTFAAGVHHAVGATNGSTGLRVEGNVFIDIECEVGLDKTSKQGYVGPESKCAP